MLQALPHGDDTSVFCFANLGKPIMTRHRTTTLTLALAVLAAAATLAPAPALAQAGHNHIKHVSESFGGTPDEAGLLATAVAEAEIALQHASLAAGEQGLAAIKQHIGHVLHAVQPAEGARGPGKGYGLLRAAEGVVNHITMAAEADGASDAVKAHAGHVAAAAANVVQWAGQLVELAQEAEASTDAGRAHGVAEEMLSTLQAVVDGMDADGDGRTSWGEGEGGLAQAQQHLELLLNAEGIGSG